MTELESIMLRKIRRFKQELDIMEDMLINGLQECDKKPVRQKQEKYNPSVDLPYFNDNDFQEVWKEYMGVRIRKKASNTDRAIKGAISKIKELSKGNKQIAIKLVDRSVNSGWTGIFPLKEEDMPTVKKKPTPNKWNYRKEAEENPEDYTRFDPNNLMGLVKTKIKKVEK